MKIERLVLLSCVLLAAHSASAATRTWDGGSTANSNWTTPANWQNDVAPVVGDDLVFATGTRSPSNNNYAPGTTFNSLTMGLGGHTITGNAIALNAGFSSLGGFVQLASIKLNASQTFSTPSGGGGIIASGIDTNGQTLTVDGAGTMQLQGVVGGSGALVKNGAGRMDLTGTSANTYTGQTRVNDGLVQLGKSLFLAAVSGSVIVGDNVGDENSAIVRLLAGEQIPGNVTINNDGQLDLNGRAEYVGSLTLSGGNVVIGSGELDVFEGATATGGTISSTGDGMLALYTNFTTNPSPEEVVITAIVDLVSGTRTFDVGIGEAAVAPGLTINGVVRSGGLVKTGGGRLTLKGNNTYTGPTMIRNGELQVDGQQSGSLVTVDGGILSGTGTIGPLTVTAGVVAPNLGSSSTYLNVSGNVQFDAASTYRFTKAPRAPVADGRLEVAGQVDLGGCTLELIEVLAPSGFLAGATTILILNDGSDPVIGTFDGLPEGASISQFGRNFTLSYRGGDGNDVTLYERVTRTWDGGGADSNWMTKENWVDDVTPNANDELVFPDDALRKNNSNNFPAGTPFHSITFSGVGYAIGGNAISLRAGVSATKSGSNSIVLESIKLVADQTFALLAGGTLSIHTSIETEGYLLTCTTSFVANSLHLNRRISGSGGLHVSGAGGVTLESLAAPNTYTGATTVSSGRLHVRTDQPGSSVLVTGGQLLGPGSFGPIRVASGRVWPLDGVSITMRVAGDFTVEPDGEAQVAVGRNQDGLFSGQFDVAGAVNIGGSTLIVTEASADPLPGDQVTILENDGTDPIVGTFASRPEGSTFTHRGLTATISYIGGDGNDVVLSFSGPTPTPTPTATASVTPTVSPTPTAGPSVSPSPTASPGEIPAALGNIATRLRVETGNNVLIGGLIITGSEPKRLIVRAIGPSSDVPGALQDPQLEIYRGAELVASNDNWRAAPNQQEIIDSTVAPLDDRESAILETLEPGAYTAVVSGVGGGTGVGVVEAYDLDLNADSEFANIATRGFVQTGDDVMIGGLIVVGTATQNVLVRALGPSLGITGQLEDPLLQLFDANGDLVVSNDNWKDTQQAEIEATTIPPSKDPESAIVATLPPALYTAVVRGVENTSGVALVEVYALP